MADLLTEEMIYQKSPQELTSLLYEALIDNLCAAGRAVEKKDYEEANRKLQKANDILYRLGAGLNYEAGIIADQLEALYNYMAGRVIAANVKKDAGEIRHVLSIAERIAGAWNEAVKKNPDVRQEGFHKIAHIYEQNVMVLEQNRNAGKEGKYR